MKPVFQEPMDGQCVRACIASIFDLPMEAGPRVQCDGHTWDSEKNRFVCTVPEHRATYGSDENPRFTCDGADSQDKWIQEWASQFGLRYVSMYMDYYSREAGPRRSGDYHLLPPGYCVASGRSPRFNGNHAVVWDTRLSDFEHPYGRMVHDPAPVPEGTRPGIGYVEHFSWFEVEDPSLLHKLYYLAVAPSRLESNTS
jgi:hypothetical protein